METKSRRFVLNLPEELEEEIQMTKEQFFHDTSYSENVPSADPCGAGDIEGEERARREIKR